MAELLNTCTREIVDIVPQIMQAIRVEMRRNRGSDISIPQFRTLRLLGEGLLTPPQVVTAGLPS
ncbi:MAG: hypothetical protein A2X25_00180 [Chloroflexi bacterium GWB2_49_20]|nr:MAG: hypothetical protein A2X25_00180 [Chloroflexi bacterium GWB2_49_20]OGN76916.1 MAG: hypothetical protein A2X26_13385 [Chloroflexi bacterium GWC2_49_37]OGN84888.1 MAG: hypothetical protein A2X27_15070 [Chloroflexi bacterium GWD2_49_16]HCM96593.1 hypothetical protein [Anaerolineae bacterium]